MKISVVVPMYNVEAYLQQCLDSLQAQTHEDLEVILVNDGSTDGTSRIAEEYCKKNPSWKLIQKKNGGLSDARNAGLPHCTGECIAFLDSDDWVEPNLYEKLAACMNEDVDVCVTDIQYSYEDPTRCFVMKGLSARSAASVNKRALLSPMFAWNKLYRAEWFMGECGLRYPVGTWYEDIPVTTVIFAKSRGIAYLPECLIHYRQREGSIMSSCSDPRVHDIFNVMASVRGNFEKLGLLKTYQDEVEWLHIEHLRLYGMFRFIRSTMYSSCYEESEEVMQKYFPKWKKNPYIKDLSFKNRMFLKFYGPHTAGVFDRLIK